jgi:O-antigen/teichoic acid export membrane protein
MVKGSAWTVGVRWAARALGLVSTLFLARLLMPKDFGIVTIGMIVVGTVEVFNQTGQHQAIIRHPAPTRQHYDAAWTIFIILSTILGACVFFAAPLADIYFHEPSAIAVVRILALKTFITGFENVGIVDFQRDLRFHRQFIYQVIPSVIAFFVTIVAAFALRNYWALVIGILSQEFSRIMLSYILSPFRPRLSLAKAADLWSFSIWTFLKSIAGYLGNQVDKLAIGSFAGAAAMGRYEVAVDVSSSPSQEINNPMISVLFPVMSKVQHDRRKLKELYLTVLYWSVLVCTSTGVGVALVTGDLVDVVLGPKWVDVKPLMPWLALAYCISGIGASTFPTFDTIGKPQISARMQWINVVIFALVMGTCAVFFRSLHTIVVARFFILAFLIPVLFVIVARELEIHAGEFFRVFWRPVLAAAIMSAAVLAIQSAMPAGILRLVTTVVAGAGAFVGCIMAVWRLSGCPDGPEKTLWHFLQRIRSKVDTGGTFSHDLETGEGLLYHPSKDTSLAKVERQAFSE